jgi:hypothetical protein
MLRAAQLDKKLPVFGESRTPNVVTTACHKLLAGNQLNPANTLENFLIKIHFNITVNYKFQTIEMFSYL